MEDFYMSKIIFSKETIKKLKQNHYVKRVSEKSITYSDEFKRLFIERYLKGNTPLSKDDIINKQEAKIKLLEEQLELLKKLDMTERRLVNSYVNLTNSESYKLILKAVSKKRLFRHSFLLLLNFRSFTFRLL